MFSRERNIFFALLLLFIFVGSSHAQIPVGCSNQTSPCSGNGVCTRYSTCLCNTYYTGDSCEITTATDSRATIVDGGIPVGGLVAIVVGWIGFAVFSFIGFIFAFWRVGKSNKNWSTNKKSRGNLPTTSAHVETDKTFAGQDGMNNMLTELSQLNNNKSRFGDPADLQRNLNQSTIQNQSRMDLGDDDDKVLNRAVTRIEQPVIREFVSNGDDFLKADPQYTKLLASRLAKYQPIPNNVNWNQYSRESQAFVNDAIRDIPGHLASYLMQEEDIDKTTEIREDQIALNINAQFIKGKPSARHPDDDDVGEEGDIERSKSTRKYY